MFNLTFFELLQKGGITVIVLGFFSIVSIAVMLERAFFFRSFKRGIDLFYRALADVVAKGGAEAGAILCTNAASPLASIYVAGYARRKKGRDEVLRAMELAGRGELSRLDRLVGLLGTIGSTAPFIGLFGTVLGIIRAFSNLSSAHASLGPAAVADGIAEALVATAVGLFVAVPAVMAYNYFVRTSSKYALVLEAKSSEFVDMIMADNDKRES